MVGRGLLGKWGANFAADPIVTFTGKDGIYFLGVIRGDTGDLAIPGGMADHGETVGRTLQRELGEETAADVSNIPHECLFVGYVDDPRNTDNAWMETYAGHFHISEEMARAMNVQVLDSVETKAVGWHMLTTELLSKMYATHGELLRLAVDNLACKGERLAKRLIHELRGY